jgi:hypothetical protein
MRLSSLSRLAALGVAYASPLALAQQVQLNPATPATRQSLPTSMSLLDVGNGFGQLLPHRVAELDTQGVPTGAIVDVRDLSTLLDHVTSTNGILPATNWPPSSVLPGGNSGNHFLVVRFDQVPDIDFILDAAPSAAANSQLLGTLTVVAVDPLTGARAPVQGRAFVGGQTYAGTPSGTPPTLPLQTWVAPSGLGTIALAGIDNDGNGFPDGLGFPGTEGSFTGDHLLALPNAFVFVADTDGDLATHETFPSGQEITVEISSAIHALSGQTLAESAFCNSTVGADVIGPEVRFTPPPNSAPQIVPTNGDQNVDPMTTVTIDFTESVQPTSFGALTGASAPGVSAAVALEFGPSMFATQMPYSTLPASVWNLSRIVFTPAFPFPGGGQPSGCGDFSLVNIAVAANQLQDIAGNLNSLSVNSSFHVGSGPGVANAPVAPDAIYVGRFGARVGVSVIDLNGFGASSGDPTYDPLNVTEGNSNFPNNPNVRLMGTLLRPPLALGACTVDGGSAGVFTTTKDSNLDDLLASSPILQGASDMALGAPLDLAFNNAPAPFGCQQGGGNLCALDGLQVLNVVQAGPNSSALMPMGLVGFPLNAAIGSGNPISFAPHPNPPPLIFPPLCVAPSLGGQQPTSVETTTIAGLTNLLVPGDPFGVPALNIPPSGLLVPEQNTYFQGVSLPGTLLANCQPYEQRQQVGHFLYVVDRVRREVVVFNSNRMTPIERIPLSDPTELAMAPNLDMLCVTNQATGTVDFIDTNPSSASFHQVIQTQAVGAAPRGVAWDSGNEDILVCNEGDGTVSILSALTLNVRKVLSADLTQPFAIALTPRQAGFGLQRNVYFGYILNRNGGCTIYESGPGGVNGWGYDDTIGRAPYNFRQPKSLQVDPLALTSAVWILHEGEINVQTGQSAPAGTGAASHLKIRSAILGQLPLPPGLAPHMRSMTMCVNVSLGTSVLSGIPVDLAFDDQRNFGALQGEATPFSAGVPAQVNGKGLVRNVGGVIRPSTAPHSLFLAIPNPTNGAPGVVDVVSLTTLNLFDTNAFQPGVQSVPMPGVVSLANYFRQ